jgi:DnaJ-class molecular chaperone
MMDTNVAKSILDIKDVKLTAEAVKKAYRKKVKEWHPDKFHTAEDSVKANAEMLSKQINEAYSFLVQNLEKMASKLLIHETLFEFARVDL